MEAKRVLKTLVKLFFAAPLLTISMMSLALESFDLAKEDTSAPVPTIDDKNESEAKQADYSLDLSANEEDNSTEESKDSDYKLEISANDDAEDDTEEANDSGYKLQLSANNDDTEESDSEEAPKSTNS